MSIGPRRDARAGMSFGRKAGLGLALAGALIVAAPSVAGAQDVDPAEAVTALGQQTNLLWIVIGAVLVDLHAGRVRPGRDRASAVPSTPPTWCRRTSPSSASASSATSWSATPSCSAATATCCRATTSATPPRSAMPSSAAATGSSCGRAASPSRATPIVTAGGRRRHRLLPLHGGLHGHRGHDPHRGHGRAVEVERLRRVGPVLRRHLLPDLRGLDLGRRLARQDLGHHGPRRRVRRLRRLGRRPRGRRRGRVSPAPSCSAPASASSTRTGRPTRCPATTSRWRCWAASSCCSAGSASTPPRRWPPPTSSSRWSPPTRPSPVPSAPSWRCS